MNGTDRSALYWHLKAIGLNPEYANAHYGLATIYGKLGNKEKVSKHWQEYIRLAPDTPWAEDAARHIYRERHNFAYPTHAAWRGCPGSSARRCGVC